jgi:WS/DGAT/MGAT family acyltransferase
MTKFLDPLDSAFILLETPGTSMNIGAVVLLAADKVKDPQKRFANIRRVIEDRIHEIPVLTQRVVRAPFDMTWPILIRDDKFDLDRHVVRVALPTPGSRAQLDSLVSEFLSRTLSSQRPLWQLLVIEGLDDGRTALVMKAHHALADGVSFAETFANFFDISPEVRPAAPQPSGDETEETVRTSLGLLREGLGKIRDRPALVVESLASWAARLVEMGRAFIRVISTHGRRHATLHIRSARDVAQRGGGHRKGVLTDSCSVGRCEARRQGSRRHRYGCRDGHHEWRAQTLAR